MNKRRISLKIAVFALLFVGMVLCGKSYANAQELDQPMYVAIRNIRIHPVGDKGNKNSFLIPYREKVDVSSYDKDISGWVNLLYKGKEYRYYNRGTMEVFVKELPDPNFVGNNPYQDSVLQLAKEIYEEWDTAYGHGASNGVPAADGKYYFDCSGFASYIMDQGMAKYVPTYNISANIEKLYNTKSIYNKGLTGECKVTTLCQGTLDESKLEPGDVLFFNVSDEGGTSSRGYNHCTFYLGNGEMIHSSHSFGGEVRVMPLDDFYRKGFVVAKRYLPQTVKASNQTHYAAQSTTVIYVNADSDGAVLQKIGLMDKVKVLFTDNGNWAQVQLSNGKKGYTLIRNLCKDLTGTGISCKVRNSGLKLYKKPKTSAKSITVSKGKRVILIGNTGKFYKVKYNGAIYYIHAPKKIADKLTTY